MPACKRPVETDIASYPSVIIDHLVSHSKLPMDGRILEIGSGTGKATTLLAGLGFPIVSLEPGPDLAAIARRNLRDFTGIEIVDKTFEDWTIGPDLFDLVVSAQAIHWIRPDLRFTKTADALVSGGFFAILGNSTVYDRCDLRDELNTIYEKEAPSLMGPPPTAWYGDSGPIASMFAESDRFERATHRRYDWTRTYTEVEYLGLLQTHSNHRMLPAAQLDQLLTSIGKLIRSRNHRIELSYEAHLYLARRVPREAA